MPAYEEVVDFIERVQELEKALGVPPEGEEVRGDEVDVIGIKKLMQEKGLGFAMRTPIAKLQRLSDLIHSTEDDSLLETKLAIIEMQEGLTLKRCEQLKEVAALTDRLLDRKAFEVTDEQKRLLEDVAKEMEEAKLKAESRSKDINDFIGELSSMISFLNEQVATVERNLEAKLPMEARR